MTSPTIWRSRPVFITSTFLDMHAERDWLRVHVFPVLEDRLRERFHHLETVDLRWGVDSASAEQEHDRELAVLTVCLREIERSRPFLIGLLGDRYGWRPPAARITAAAREAGLGDDVADKSVTELEILYGVLRSPAQRQRSWFYFRDPLPYGEMLPEVAQRYSEAHSGAADAAANVERLDALKARLTETLPGRVRTYHARWDPERQSVSETDLEVWGAQVLQDLWSDLEAETAASLREAPRTWQQQDRWALDEFIEGRVRGFVGRAAITGELAELAESPVGEKAPWGACVTAEAGGGKSSLFGHLYRTLQQKNVLVLAHAAGISVRSTQVNWMLRRWVTELARTLGHPDPLDEGAVPEEIDRAFARLFAQAAEAQRVVVLLDALDQFESTPRGTHLTWLPRVWPPNARLIATAIPGVQSRAILQRPSVVEKPLSPVDQAEAAGIVRSICTRYHRTLNARVETALLDKRRGDGTASYGNPLWLELATEELNLLGAEAFDRAEVLFPDVPTGAERIIQLLLSVVGQLPGDIEGLYGWMLDSAERNFGRAWTRAFVEPIAVSRGGWRESDLQHLVARLSGERWEALRFAAVRRALRAHVVQRGAHAQWDFAHAQMRRAVEQRLGCEGHSVLALHREIAAHLLNLRPEDPLRQTEAMVHLVQTGDLRQAASHYGSDLPAGDASGATTAFAWLIVQKGVGVASLLDQPVDAVRRARIGERFLYELDLALEHAVPLDVRLDFVRAAERAFGELAATEPGNARWQRDLAVSHGKIGDARRVQGNLAGAFDAYQAMHRILEGLATADPGNAQRQRDLAESYRRVGAVPELRGDGAGALAAYQANLGIAQRLAEAAPRNADRQHSLAISHNNIGALRQAQGDLAGALAAYQAGLGIAEQLAEADPGNAKWRDGLAVCHQRIGDVQMARGDEAAALRAYQTSLGIAEQLAAADPGNADWQHNLAVSLSKIGAVRLTQGHPVVALRAYEAAHRIVARLAATDPGNTNWQRDLSDSHRTIGAAREAQRRHAAALQAYEAALAIAERLAAADPSNAGWQHNLAKCNRAIGRVREAQYDLAGALRAYQTAVGIADRLVEVDPRNADWQYDLSLSHEDIGDVLVAERDVAGALRAYQTSLGIRERLAAADPANAKRQSDLARIRQRLARLPRA